VVVVNRGTHDGLEVGHVLAISQAGATVTDEVSGKRGDTVTLPTSAPAYSWCSAPLTVSATPLS